MNGKNTSVFSWKLCYVDALQWPSIAQYHKISTTQHIGLTLLCCVFFAVLRLVSVVLRHVSVVLCYFRCVGACFHCVVEISLCCGLFLLCCANFVMLWRFHCAVDILLCCALLGHRNAPLRPGHTESQWESTVGKHLSGFKIFKIVSKRCFVYISHICVYLVYHCFGFSFWMTNIQYTIDSCWYRQPIPLTQAQNVLVCSRL